MDKKDTIKVEEVASIEETKAAEEPVAESGVPAAWEDKGPVRVEDLNAPEDNTPLSSHEN